MAAQGPQPVSYFLQIHSTDTKKKMIYDRSVKSKYYTDREFVLSQAKRLALEGWDVTLWQTVNMWIPVNF